ncbi:MAG: hypothetical protein ACXU8A_01165 [Burkholderiaceae bacterium]
MIANQHILHVSLYLLPSIVLALFIKALSERFIVFTFLTLAGTLCHEMAHYIVGFLTNARPTSISIIPRKIDRHHYQMGAATFSNLRWYNAAITALAPILILAIPLLYADWRVRNSSGFTGGDVAMMFFLAPQFLCFWPSRTDWMLALRSWPYLLLLIPIFWYWKKGIGLFSLGVI